MTQPQTATLDMTHKDPSALRVALIHRLEQNARIGFIRVESRTDSQTFRAKGVATVHLELTHLEVVYSGDLALSKVRELIDEWMMLSELGSITYSALRYEDDLRTLMTPERRSELEGEAASAPSQYEHARAFRQGRCALEALRRLNNSGTDVYAHLQALAKATADHGNAHARMLAKRFNRRPQLITVSSLLRN